MTAFAAYVARLLRRSEGNVAITFALMAVPLLSVSGIAVDYARALQARQLIQSAADAAALSGAQQGDLSEEKRRELAQSMFQAHLSGNGFLGEITPDIDVSGRNVTITVTTSVPTIFAGLAGQDSFAVSARAAAEASDAMTEGGTACVLALNDYVSEAFSLNGTTSYEAINCATYTNSPSSAAMRAVGGAEASASAFYSAGGASGADHFDPLPILNQPPLNDPLADLLQPISTACASNAKGTSKKKGSHTLTPGTYCGGLKVQAQANVYFTPGIYVIKNGELELMSGSNSWGDGVHFHFIGNNAHLKVRGGAHADFKAMTSGDYAGILFAQDPDAAPGGVSDVQGGGNVRLVGALYFPTQQVDVGGNGDLGLDTDAWAIIADRVRVHGNGRVRIKADFASAGFPEILPKIGIKPPHLTQ